MLIYDDLRPEVVALKKDIDALEAALAIEKKEQEIKELDELSAQPDFWNDSDNSQKILQKSSGLKNVVSGFKKLCERQEDLLTMIDIAVEADDDSMEEEIKQEYNSLTQAIAETRLQTLLTGEYDDKNAILTFHSGAGGTEAQDWTMMLFRMYQHWAERKGFKITTLDYLAGEEAGIKSVTILIEGLNAYGFLKSEMGVHRLVRVSPFDSSGRRHTSFASLEVMPEIDDSVEIDIRPEELEVSAFRSGGAGGQNVNKVSSAVRIVHIPTGIVTTCQTERSQLQNKAYAMKMLISKLVEIKEREHLDKISDIKGVQKEIAWGSQIRSYVFMPYTLVKDHRTGFENGNVQAVMDGEIDGFINAYLAAKSRGEIQ